VRFWANGKQWSKAFRTHDAAKAYRRKVEGEELAGLVTNPTGGERLSPTTPRAGSSTDW
jgi:hypothetical protein